MSFIAADAPWCFFVVNFREHPANQKLGGLRCSHRGYVFLA
jgi:hypothetical protein